MSDSILTALKADQYRIGDLQVLVYDRKKTDFFPEGYLSRLYWNCKASGRRPGLGILPTLFCGMADISHDAITTYLSTRPVLILGEWTSPTVFQDHGICFPSTLPVIGLPKGPERSLFAGYGYFKSVWGRKEAEILGMLGLAYLFSEFDVSAIHGLRLPFNDLTAKFTRKFGFVDDGLIPRYMLYNGKLVGAIASTLLIENFEVFVERKLLELSKREDFRWAATKEEVRE